MKIVVAMDSFKGSLGAREACEAVKRGLSAIGDGRLEVVSCPLADGGEGTARVLAEHLGGEWVEAEVTGPLPDMRVRARYLYMRQPEPAALVEMASASGLELLRSEARDPLRTTTYGTGELLRLAVERGVRKLWLALGGSATVDGGTGAAAALGWRFLDKEGREIPPGGGELRRIATICRPSEPLRTECVVLADVNNPLLGPRGAACVFGPQKGASPAAVAVLEDGLARLADRIEAGLGLDVRTLRGAGAAGGFGAGAVAFLGGRLEAGAEAVLGILGFHELLEGAAWVVTGEGRFDEQSLHGKVVSAVAAAARTAGVPVAVLAGRAEMSPEAVAAHGIAVVEEAARPGVSEPEALAEAEKLLQAAAERFARRWLAPTR